MVSLREETWKESFEETIHCIERKNLLRLDLRFFGSSSEDIFLLSFTLSARIHSLIPLLSGGSATLKL